MKISITPLLSSVVLSASCWAMALQSATVYAQSDVVAERERTKTNHVYNSDYASELNKLLTELNRITGVPGFSVSIVQNGKEVASVATGLTDINKQESSKRDSIFRLASVSKIIGATMLADLVDKGRLDPDATISHYIPRLPKHYQNLTVRQLVSHTSGMPHYQAVDYDIYDRHYDSAQQALTTLKARDLNSKPGHEYLYSTHGYTLAGAVFEAIQKQSIQTALPQFLKAMDWETHAYCRRHN